MNNLVMAITTFGQAFTGAQDAPNRGEFPRIFSRKLSRPCASRLPLATVRLSPRTSQIFPIKKKEDIRPRVRDLQPWRISRKFLFLFNELKTRARNLTPRAGDAKFAFKMLRYTHCVHVYGNTFVMAILEVLLLQ